MKVELHLHTSRYSLCASAQPNELMLWLMAAGYGAVYITEHHAVWREQELAELRQTFPKLGIFPGVELDLTDSPLQHLLVLGTTDPSYLSVSDPAAVLDKARAEGHLTVLAHPYRWEGAAQILDDGLLPDAIECRTCNHDFASAAAARARAEQLGLPSVNAGDVHSLEMIGRFWIETSRPVRRAEDIRQIIVDRAYENHPPGPGGG
jgi:predicted metal-dependent phosphoesterase TrpH